MKAKFVSAWVPRRLPNGREVLLLLQLFCVLPGHTRVRAHYCEVGTERDESNRWRWVLPYEDPCECTSIRLGGMNTDTPIRPFHPVYVEEPLLSDDIEKIRDHYGLQCKKAIKCATIAAPVNGAIDSDDETFAVGATLGFTCDTGFTLSGTNQLTCQSDGTFNNEAPTCEAIKCATIAAPVNGAIDSDDEMFAVGATLGFTCNPGFTLSGTNPLMCQNNGTFNNATPTCEATKCATITAPVNGALDSDDEIFAVGATLGFTCNPGFTLSGTNPLMCQSDGTFNDAAPTCEATKCATIAAPVNGALDSDDEMFAVGATLGFTCNPGFTLSGTNPLMCQNDGTFNDAAPTCEATKCDVTAAPVNGALDSDDEMFAVGATLGFTYNPGFTLSGTNPLMCQNDGTFNDAAPTCEATKCAAIAAPMNGALASHDEMFAVGATLGFTCNPGFTLSGTNPLTCQSDGTFNDVAPICEAIKCDVTATPMNGALDTDDEMFAVGATLVFTCNPGFTISGTNPLTCQSDGTFNDVAPICYNDKPIHLGCFVDHHTPGDELRALPDGFLSDSQMTLEMCFEYCKEQGARYAGLQFYTHCFCGNDGVDHNKYGMAASNGECNSPCGGNSGQICGGTWRNNVYDLF